jgi:hexosaminidase
MGQAVKFQEKFYLLLVACCAALTAVAGNAPLIPAPQKIEWRTGELDCSRYQIIAPAAAAFAAGELERYLAGAKRDSSGTKITLQLGSVASTNAEAYTLDAAKDGVFITAPKLAGLFYGVQTLRQLLAGGTKLPCCHIEDWPAFPIRGFMHDVGRNFQTINSLKAQLDIFAAYKLNVFHWHLTDNPAWRIECRTFPQLNDPKFQQRDLGQIYSYSQIRDLIAYARERHITVIPELDMPGHSDYFKRAFGFDMGSPEGMGVLEKLIAEFCAEISAADCPYLHLGSDEVHIKDPTQFMARMLKAVRDHGRQAVIWNPGLKGDAETVLQLWREGPSAPKAMKPGEKFVDSGGGYLNGYDPLLLVQRYFFRQPCLLAKANNDGLGGILCCWPDVRVADKQNIFRQNAVWPGVLIFSESVWHGVAKNQPDFLSVLPPGNSEAMHEFCEMENKIAFHRDHYFSGQPFPFVKFSQIPWRIVGPFPRGTNEPGDFAFEPEKKVQDSYRIGNADLSWREIWGGKVSLSDVFKMNSIATAYALTYVHADAPKTIHAWIGFETPARSNRKCGGIPLAGQWDAFGGTVLVNDSPLPAPVWKQPGKNRYLSPTWFTPANEEPYTDEEFYWTRAPAEISLQPGWNKILLRVPCGYTSQNWGFSFIPVKLDAANSRWIEDETVQFATEPK